LSAATLGTPTSAVKRTVARHRKRLSATGGVRGPSGPPQLKSRTEVNGRPPRLPRTAALVARVGLALTLAGALSLLLSGVGTRWDWWDYRTGFLLLRWTLYAGLVVIVVALTGLVLGL